MRDAAGRMGGRDPLQPAHLVNQVEGYATSGKKTAVRKPRRSA